MNAQKKDDRPGSDVIWFILIELNRIGLAIIGFGVVWAFDSMLLAYTTLLEIVSAGMILFYQLMSVLGLLIALGVGYFCTGHLRDALENDSGNAI